MQCSPFGALVRPPEDGILLLISAKAVKKGRTAGSILRPPGSRSGHTDALTWFNSFLLCCFGAGRRHRRRAVGLPFLGSAWLQVATGPSSNPRTTSTYLCSPSSPGLAVGSHAVNGEVRQVHGAYCFL
jgi:hypothetical protein